MQSDGTEPVIVDTEEIFKFALIDGKAKQISVYQTEQSFRDKKSILTYTDADNSVAEDIIREVSDSYSYTDVSIEWEFNGWDSGVYVNFGVSANNEITVSSVVYPFRHPISGRAYTGIKEYGPANWREAIMFAANEWWKDE